MEESLGRERYALIIRLPREAEVRIEDAYLGLMGATKPNMGYHVTLLGPFHLVGEASLESLEVIAKVCRRWKPFRLRISGLGSFPVQRDDVHLVYLRVKKPKVVSALHSDLLETMREYIVFSEGIDDTWHGESYTPHVTLGLDLSSEQLEEFLRIGAEEDIDESFRVSRIWLVRQEPHGPWEFLESCPLGAISEEEERRANR
ncbi:MAG: hypothetical protein A2Y73_03785 [Chloroflexi bacterium RBG_13_56_8]|nr:MAG: hypothetical protein A2Y73_03785 [Chloroflexi bacterium RBG_13_56_8]